MEQQELNKELARTLKTKKCRAWDKEHGEMIYPYTGKYDPYLNLSHPAITIFPDAIDPENYTWIVSWDGVSDKKKATLHTCLICTEYTGFNNEAGEEIWEGDIVEHPATNYKGRVFYGTDAYFIKWYDEEGNEKAISSGLGGLLNKVGNVFENPELIQPIK